MSARQKTLLLVLTAFVCSVGILYTVSSRMLLQNYLHLEDVETRSALQRVLAALDFDQSELRNAASDWARWDDAYEFVEDGNAEFVQENLLDQSFRNLRLNFMAFVHESGRITFAKAFDLAADQEVAVPPELHARLTTRDKLLQHADAASVHDGVVMVAGQPMLIASLPILPSTGEGMNRGTLVWGRYLNDGELRVLRNITQLHLTARGFAEPSLPADWQQAVDGFGAGDALHVQRVDNQIVAGYALVRDVYGAPAVIMRVELPRVLYHSGLMSTRYFLVALVIIGVIVCGVVLVLVDRLILARLIRLSRHVTQIAARGDSSARVAVEGRDELGQFAEAMNAMLASLENSHRERTALEDKFLQAQKAEAMGRLAGGVAHDFNNILTAILGFADLLAARVTDNTGAQRYVGEIRKAAERASGLTQQMLAFSRRQVLQPRVLDLNSVVTGVQKMLRRIIGEDIELAITLGSNLGRVRADRMQLEQVIINLAVNARDALPRGGKLSIQTDNLTVPAGGTPVDPELAAGEYVALVIKDTGTGMSEEAKQHLFEPFFTTKEQGKGTGLGLATCYGIVKQSEGSIEIESAVGCGTTVRVLLPRTTGEVDADEQPPAVPVEELPTGTETVLVVEDDAAVREVAAGVLRELGYQVMEASNGDEALRLALRHEGRAIDLVLTDVVMPLMGGKELAERMERLFPRTNMVFTSGYSTLTQRAGTTIDESGSFIPKPFTATILARKVREVLDKEGQRVVASHLLN